MMVGWLWKWDLCWSAIKEHLPGRGRAIPVMMLLVEEAPEVYFVLLEIEIEPNYWEYYAGLVGWQRPGVLRPGKPVDWKGGGVKVKLWRVDKDDFDRILGVIDGMQEIFQAILGKFLDHTSLTD